MSVPLMMRTMFHRKPLPEMRSTMRSGDSRATVSA